MSHALSIADYALSLADALAPYSDVARVTLRPGALNPASIVRAGVRLSRAVPPEDPAALAQALVELGRDELLRRKLGEVAIGRAEAFSTAVADAKMRAVYETLAREKGLS